MRCFKVEPTRRRAYHGLLAEHCFILARRLSSSRYRRPFTPPTLLVVVRIGARIFPQITACPRSFSTGHPLLILRTIYLHKADTQRKETLSVTRKTHGHPLPEETFIKYMERRIICKFEVTANKIRLCGMSIFETVCVLLSCPL